MKDTMGRENRKLEDRICPECGKTFRPLRSISKYCSRVCHWKNNGGRNKKSEVWWENPKGYIEGKIWVNDSFQIRVKRHRFVMEGYLGRPLEKWEDVHHIDGNKSNNAIENLELISHSEHSKRSNRNRIYKKGYKLNLTPEERKARSLRAIARRLHDLARKTEKKET